MSNLPLGLGSCAIGARITAPLYSLPQIVQETFAKWLSIRKAVMLAYSVCGYNAFEL